MEAKQRFNVGLANVASRQKRRPNPTNNAQGFASIETKIVQVAVKGRVAPGAERALLLDLFCHQWPKALHTKFVLMPGGFIHRPWPTSKNYRLGWNTSPNTIAALVKQAALHIGNVVTIDVYNASQGKADFLVLGIDLSQAKSKSNNERSGVELVAVLDLRSGKVLHWTGKSYPTANQEERLAHVVDLDTHFLKISPERVLIFGCHDLTMFNPRGRTALGLRKQRRIAMQRKVRKFKPTVILHLPHRTVKPRTWLLPWSVLKQKSSVTAWASGIGYYGKDAEPLEHVLAATSSGGPAVESIILDAVRYHA